MENNSCDVCGLEYSGEECPKCIVRCPICNDILAEDAIDSYNVGNCPHFICLFNSVTGYFLWRNEEYEKKFIQLCNYLNNNKIDLEINGEYLIPFDTEKTNFDHFALTNNILSIEHDILYSPIRNRSIYLFYKKE